MANTRVEKDSLGSVKVPIDSLYGAQTQRAVQNFDYEYRPMPSAFLMALVQVKKSAALANAALSILPRDKSQAIVRACDQLLEQGFAPKIIGQHFPVNVFQTGSGTSSNMNANEVIATLATNESVSIKTDSDFQATPNEKLSIHPNDDVNLGQSSNDVIPTTIQLALANQVNQNLAPALSKAIVTLDNLAEKYRSVIKTGRTHLMDAMPLSLGDEITTWSYQLNESKTNIERALDKLCEIPLGGTAIGTGINRHKKFPQTAAKFLSKALSLDVVPSKNLASRIASQDPVLEMHSHIKVLATILMKICNDIRWMNSGPNSGLSEIQLKALQPGSSIMPGKVNPVIPESIAMMCAKVMGNDTTLTVANQSGNFQLNVMLPLIALVSLESVQLMTDSLIGLSEKGLCDLQIFKDQLAAKLEKNPILATALNPHIGYDAAAKIAKKAAAEDKTVFEIALAETSLSESELKSILDPKRLAFPHD